MSQSDDATLARDATDRLSWAREILQRHSVRMAALADARAVVRIA